MDDHAWIRYELPTPSPLVPSLSDASNTHIGITAGVAAAILSHPADTLLSQINKGHGPKGPMVGRLITLGKEAGFKGLFAGLGPRIIMSEFGADSSGCGFGGAVRSPVDREEDTTR